MEYGEGSGGRMTFAATPLSWSRRLSAGASAPGRLGLNLLPRWFKHLPIAKNEKADPLRGPALFILVAGAGFEPATFGL